MQDLFTSLSHAVEGAPLVALTASLVWGVLSVVLSPCHLSSIPLIVGFISGQGRVTAGRAFSLAALFAVGILITIAVIGAITAAAGRMLGDVGRWGNYAVALVFLMVGLQLLGLVPTPWPGPGQVGLKRKGLAAAFLLGLVFGIALGPCTFAFMAPVLGVAFKAAQTTAVYGTSLLLAYGIGHCAVIVLAGTSTELVQRYLNWNEQSRAVTLLKGSCGGLVLLGGVWLVLSAR
jgi:cytochrome c-type biogenesis protein